MALVLFLLVSCAAAVTRTIVWLISLEPDNFFCPVLVLLMFGSINGIHAEVRPDSASVRSKIFVRGVILYY